MMEENKPYTNYPEPSQQEVDQIQSIQKQELGPIVLVWSTTQTRKGLATLRRKIKTAHKKWDGVIVHLQPGETLGSLKMAQCQTLYEALMSRFDPDLFSVRMARKATAEAEHVALSEEMTDQMVEDQAAETAQRLEAVRAEVQGG